MKINIVPACLAVVIAGIVALLCHYGYESVETKIDIAYTVLVFATVVSPFLGLVGISFEESKRTVNLKVLSLLFLFIGAIADVTTILCVDRFPIVYAVAGLLLCIYVSCVYSLTKTKM